MIGEHLFEWKRAALYNIIILHRCSSSILLISCIYIGSLMLLMGSLDVYNIYNRFILTFQITFTCMVYMYIYSITQ